MSQEKRTAYFYSFDGRIWYWGRFADDERAAFMVQGVRFLVDNKRNRGQMR